MDLELEDEDVRIAVRALGAMRSGHGAGAPPVPKGGANFVFPTNNSSNTTNTITHHQQQQHQNHTSASTSTNPSTSHTPALSLSLASEAASSTQAPRTPPAQDDDEDNDDRDAEHDGAGAGTAYPTLARMQSLPLVSGALRVYEAGKANSRVVQYTSSLVSTSLRHASSRLPAGSGERIDEFAGGMLDRLDKYRRPSPAPPPASASTSTSTSTSTSATLRRGYGRPGPYDERGYVRTSYEDEEDVDVDVDVDAEGEKDEDEDEGGDVDAEGERDDDEDGDADGQQQVGYDGQGEGQGQGQDGKGKGKRRWVGDEAQGQVEGRVPGWLEGTSSYSAPDGSGSSTNGAVAGEEREEHRQVAQRSRWQAVLLEAGGLSAALSDESMRRLRYCLQWLQYATQHIDSQILVLREFIASLHPLPPAVASASSSSPSSSSSTAALFASEEPTLILTPDHLRTLAHLRSDIVHTIRQVVGVVSKYAGGALPEPARGRVRGFILDLPKRFGKEAAAPSTSSSTSSNSTSSAIGVSGVGGVGVGGGTGTGTAARRGARRERGVESVPASPTGGAGAGVRPLHPHSTAHSHSSHSHSRRGSTQGGSGVEPGKALAAAQRVLTLATESLDMMRGVTAVVGDSLDRADAWVDRLRTVGIQRGMDGLALPPHPPPSHNAAPPPHASHTHNAQQHWAAGGSPAGYPYSGAGSPGFGLGGMSLGEREEEREGGAGGGTPAGERDEREHERDGHGEGRMEVDG
ncbi:transcription factor Opi1-domain-containing protein [Mycena filopes]|nr:transcription factor Opi1-domain-containing protein [Mycena filopes]